MGRKAKVIKEAEHRDLDHAAKQMPKRSNSRIPNAAERAYNRGDLFDKCRSLMESWEIYVKSASASSKVITLNKVIA